MFGLRAQFVAARPPDPIAFMPYSTMVSIRLSSRVDKFLVRPSVVASLSWPHRGHHVPALTVTSGGRGVGFDMHAWGRLVVLRQQFVSSFHLLHLSGLRFLAYISTRRAALSCVRTDGVLTSTLSPGRAAGDHSVQTAVQCEGMRISQMCKCNGTK